MPDDQRLKLFNEIEGLLRGYISACHNLAMDSISQQRNRKASRVLRMCENYINTERPQAIEDLIVKCGLMHTVYNNLAQHANMMSDMNTSIEYLKKALDAVQDPRTNQDMLPLTETYFNLANGTSYLNRFDEALKYSEKALILSNKRINKCKSDIQAFQRLERKHQKQEALENLNQSLKDSYLMRVMSLYCIGEQYEKMSSFSQAIKIFTNAKTVAEKHFGIKHELYTKCVNAIGGARLKSKYQTKENYRVPSKKKSPAREQDSTDKKKGARRIKLKSASKSQAQGNYMTAKTNQRRNIKKLVTDTEVRQSEHLLKYRGPPRQDDNILLANCDTWQHVHCKHTRPQSSKKQSLAAAITRSRAKRPSSARRTLQASNSKESFGHNMSMLTDRRAPYKVVCKNGPGCNNHDWNTRSPIKQVCQNGLKCKNHDWDPLNSSRTSAFDTSFKQQSIHSHAQPQTIQIVQGQTEHAQQDLARPGSVASNNDSAHSNTCMMLSQSEKMFKQQMEHMRMTQEENFKMVQLMIQSQQKTASEQAKAASASKPPPQQLMYPQQMMNPMYYPWMGQGQMGYNPYQYGHHQGAMHYYPRLPESDASALSSHTDMSEPEQIRKGRRLSPDDRSDFQNSEYDDIDNKNIEIRTGKVQRNSVRKSKQDMANRDQTATMRVKHTSVKGSQHFGKESQKNFLEDSLARDPNHSIQVDLTQNNLGNVPMRSSMKQSVSRDQLLRSSHENIEKQMTNKSIQAKIMTPVELSHADPLKSASIHMSEPKGSVHSFNNVRNVRESYHSKVSSDKVREHSKSNRSFKSNRTTSGERSFRAEKSQLSARKMSQEQAARLIQKMARGKMERDNYRFLKKALQTKHIFMRLLANNPYATQVKVSLKIYGDKIVSCIFVFVKNRSSTQRVVIDMKRFQLTSLDEDELKERLQHVVQNLIGQKDPVRAVKQAVGDKIQFSEIGTADEFAEDFIEQADQRVQHQTQSLAKEVNFAEPAEQQVVGHARFDHSNDRKGNEYVSDGRLKRMQLDEEINNIKRKMENQQTGDPNSRFSSPSDDGRQQQVEDTSPPPLTNQPAQIVNVRNCIKDQPSEPKKPKRFCRKHNRGIPRPEPVRVESDPSEQQFSFQQNSPQEVIMDSPEFKIASPQAPVVEEPTQPKPRTFVIQKKLNLFQVIKVQSLIKGFLARRQHRFTRQVIFEKFENRQNHLIFFKVIRDLQNKKYILTALVRDTLDHKSIEYKELPEEAENIGHWFNTYLEFSVKEQSGIITKLQFNSSPTKKKRPDTATSRVSRNAHKSQASGRSNRSTSRNARSPAIETPTVPHMFITNYKQNLAIEKNPIKEFYIQNDKYKVNFFEIANKDHQFRVEVEFKGKIDYIKLKQLPVNMFYMAYYLDACIGVNTRRNGELDFICLHNMKDIKGFIRDMQFKEIQYFGTNKEFIMNTLGSDIDSFDAQKLKEPSHIKGKSLKTFQIEREGIWYKIDIQEELQNLNSTRSLSNLQQKEKDGDQGINFLIKAQNMNYPSDRDYMQMPHVKMDQEEFFGIVYNNLKVYTDQNDKISNIALSVTERASHSGRKEPPVRPSIRKSNTKTFDSSSKPPRKPQSQSSAVKSTNKNEDQQKPVQNNLAEFEILRGNNEYDVRVEKIEKDIQMQLYRVVVQNKDNPKDTSTLLTKTPHGEHRQMSDLVEFLEKRIKLNYQNDTKRAIKSISLLNDINDTSVEQSEDLELPRVRTQQSKASKSTMNQNMTTPIKLERDNSLEGTGPIQNLSSMDFQPNSNQFNKSQQVKITEEKRTPSPTPNMEILQNQKNKQQETQEASGPKFMLVKQDIMLKKKLKQNKRKEESSSSSDSRGSSDFSGDSDDEELVQTQKRDFIALGVLRFAQQENIGVRFNFELSFDTLEMTVHHKKAKIIVGQEIPSKFWKLFYQNGKLDTQKMIDAINRQISVHNMTYNSIVTNGSLPGILFADQAQEKEAPRVVIDQEEEEVKGDSPESLHEAPMSTEENLTPAKRSFMIQKSSSKKKKSIQELQEEEDIKSEENLRSDFSDDYSDDNEGSALDASIKNVTFKTDDGQYFKFIARCQQAQDTGALEVYLTMSDVNSHKQLCSHLRLPNQFVTSYLLDENSTKPQSEQIQEKMKEFLNENSARVKDLEGKIDESLFI